MAWTPRRPRIDYGAADAVRELSGLVLQMVSEERAAKREADERAKDRAFRKEMMENQVNLNLLAQDYGFQRQRLATLEDELSVAGYQLPEASKTSGFGEIKDRTVEGYEFALQDILTNIEQVNKERALIQAGKDFIRTQEDLHGGIIAAKEDEAWKDFMLEGNLSYDPNKPKGEQFTGTEEMSDWLNKLNEGQLDQLKSVNFRQAVLRGRRGMKEAQETAGASMALKVNRTAIALNEVQKEGAEKKIREGDYDLGMKIFTDVEKDLSDRIFEAGKNILSGLNMVTEDGRFSINYLQMLEDPDEYIDIMEDFMEANPETAQEILAIKDNFILSQQMGVDWSESVIRAQANAYSDFLEARQMEMSMGEGNRAKGIERLENLSLTDKTKSRYLYLSKRINQFKRAGLYGGGRSAEEMNIILVNSYELIKAKDKLTEDRIEADMEELSTVASKGYPVELDDFAPVYYKGQTEADQVDLLMSLALIKSIKGKPGVDPIDAEKLIETLADKVGTLQAAGLTGLDQYWDFIKQLQGAKIDLNQLVNQQRVDEVANKIDEMLNEASEMTGISKDDLIKEFKRVQSQQIPWGKEGRRRTSAGRMF